MKQYIENQYDDDLTLGTDEQNDSYYTDAEDLFELSTDDESPISRLKSLVLSIDWEITDEVLLQFNEELIDLKGIWAGESINLVYIQALEKISKYIYQYKADSHPNAIKLFLTLYYNLEKIVSSRDLTDQQKKDILLEDVKRFENLKRLIKQKSQSADKQKPERPEPPKGKKAAPDEDELLNLKAIVLGIDWEITDQDLNDLRREVLRLEGKFAESRPRLILLQGIGTIGAYIKMKKSNAHADAFKVFHLFYESLERIVRTPMTLEEEKAILFPAVEKFNSFKALLGRTISPEAITKQEDETEDEDYSDTLSGEISPALADISDDEAMGFQADDEARALGLNESGGVASHIDDFFGEGASPRPPAAFSANEKDALSADIEELSRDIMFPEDNVIADAVTIERNVALTGVDVEGDDEEIRKDNIVDLTGMEAVQPLDFAEEAVDRLSLLELEKEPVQAEVALQQDEELVFSEEEIVGATETIFAVEEQESHEIEPDYDRPDREAALKGVDVESEADDDSEEMSLPMEGVGPAPALAAMDEESIYSATILEGAPVLNEVTQEIVGTLDDLFLDQEEHPPVPVFASVVEEEPFVDANEEKQFIKETSDFDDWLKEGDREEDVSLEPGGEEVTEETTETTFGDDAKSDASVPWEPIGEDALSGVLFGENSDDSLNSNFSDNEFDQGTKESLEIDTLFDSLQPEDEKLLFSFPESSQKDTSEQNVDVAITNAAVPEEEVVFELFEEEAELGGIDVDVSALEPAEPSPATAMQAEAAEVTLPGFTGVHEIDDVSVVDMAIIEETIGSEPLGNLRACIDSLGIELEDKIIAGLFQEINKLRQKWPDRPIEKTFLQLLSTITQHIDMYRYESSAEAHSLLLSVYQVLANLQVGDLKRNQEMLLGETLRVLQWQQDMLVRQAVKRGKELTFVDPVRGDRENSNLADAQKDFDQILESSEETLEDEISSTDSIESITGYPLDSHDRAGVGDHTATLVTPGFTEKDETPLPIKAELSKETFSDDLRKEIAMLRQTLQREIAELRKELKES